MLAALAAVFLIYYLGNANGMQKCQKNMAEQNIQKQSEIIQIQEAINEEVVHTNTDDIRYFLFQNYTIAD